tara:strand:+ start:109 stop:366 length:258 start_codon:yes stop_codon:yes gene_type:complete
MSIEYVNGWRYIVWVGGVDDYYKTYNKAKEAHDEWVAKGYDDVIIELIDNVPSKYEHNPHLNKFYDVHDTMDTTKLAKEILNEDN